MKEFNILHKCLTKIFKRLKGARHSSLVTRHSSLVTRHSSLVTRHSSLVTRHSSLVTRHSSKSQVLILLFSLLTSFQSFASPASLTYQGRILKKDGTPLEFSHVSFVFQIADPAGQCVIYQEQVNNIDMSGSGGVFDVAIGNGTIQYPLTASPSILDTFNNASTFTCGTCSLSNGTYSCADGASTYTAASGDVRKLRVSFYDGAGWKTITPDNTIRSVPFAGYSLSAESAQKLGTNVASDFLLKAGLPTCGVGTFLTWNGSALTCAAVSGASGGTVTSVSSANGDLTVATGTTTPVLTLNSGTGANQIVKLDASAKLPAVDGSQLTNLQASQIPNMSAAKITTGTLSSSQMPAFTGGDVTSSAGSVNLTLANSGVTAGTYNSVTVDAKGRVTAGTNPTTLSGYGITDAVKNLGGVGNISAGADASKPASPSSGDLFVATDTQKIYRYNGTSWDLVSSAGGTGGTVTGITAGTGLTGGTITGSGTIGLGTELAGVNGLSSTGYVQRTGAGTYSTTSSSTTASSNTLVQRDGSGVSGFYGVGITGATSGAVTVQAPATVTSYSLTMPAAQGGSGQVLSNNGAGILSWVNALTNSLTSAQIFVGNASNVATGVAISGDATISNTGALTLANSGVTANTYTSVTVDAKGRVTAGTNPTTLSGYGITDAMKDLGGSPGIQTGVDASKPASPTAGTIYFATDTNKIYQYNSGAWATIASASGSGGTITALTGDVTASGSGSVAATVASVGGSSAANVNTAVVAVNTNATSNSTASVLVKRDASGISNFKGLKLDGATSGTLTQTVPASVTSYIVTWPSAVAGAANSVLASDTSGNLSWINLGSIAGSINLTSQVTGVLPIANGGTNSSAVLNNNRIMASTGGAIVEAAAITANKALISDANGIPTHSSVTNTELGYLSGVTSAIQVQLNNKQALNTELTGLGGLASTGILQRTGAGTYAALGTTAPINVTAGNIGISIGAGLTTSAGSIVPDFATTSTAGKVVQANDARLPGTTCAAGNKMRWSGSAWVCETDYADPAGTAIVAVANGGTGTVNGSITGTGALTFTAGGTNQNVTLTPSGTGYTVLNGSVGVGTTTPRSGLDVSSGSISGKPPTAANNTGTIDFSAGNLQYTTNNCGAMNLNKMQSGSTYTLAIQGTTSATCSFNAYSDAGSTALTVHLPSDHAATTAGTHTVYTFVVLGTHVYVSWIPGY
ncbi:MAG: beta strand repeat-containing protein [Pseudobdellovibrionaceae bacterium]